jgi:hypothetical protein
MPPDPIRAEAGWLAERVSRPNTLTISSIKGAKAVTTSPGSGAQPIASDRALTIAQADAMRVYRDLSPYFIRIAREDDGWHVDYELKDPKLKGGGPHYVIDPFNGLILAKRYDQ